MVIFLSYVSLVGKKLLTIELQGEESTRRARSEYVSTVASSSSSAAVEPTTAVESAAAAEFAATEAVDGGGSEVASGAGREIALEPCVGCCE
jgi:hypothetical protein